MVWRCGRRGQGVLLALGHPGEIDGSAKAGGGTSQPRGVQLEEGEGGGPRVLNCNPLSCLLHGVVVLLCGSANF